MKDIRQRRALFPISLSNNTFSTQTVVPAIRSVTEKYDAIYLLIADKIQIFNYITRLSMKGNITENKNGIGFMEIEKSIKQTLLARERWLDRIKLEIGTACLNVQWRIYDIAKISDSKSFHVLRRIIILYEVDEVFRSDVDAWARAFVARRSDKMSQSQRDIAFRMSVRYILEEAALSIRLRVHFMIADEFYIGKTIKPISNIYDNKYTTTVWELAGVTLRAIDFRFYEYFPEGPDEFSSWHQTTDI